MEGAPALVGRAERLGKQMSPPVTDSNRRGYVLVTPAKNEAATIGETIRSVLAQTVPPREWVIVSDGSTDETEAIVNRASEQHSWMRLLRRPGQNARSFASVVHVTEEGIRALSCRDHAFIGLLDADVTFPSNYFETLLQRFRADPRLGLAGGLVLDVVNGKLPWQRQRLKDIAGAVQFYRRECFESLGGLLPIPEGGWDAITCVQARANRYHTQTFPDLVVEHHKSRNSAEGSPLRRKWQMGLRDYALGNHPLFETLKCAYRSLEAPIAIGAVARLSGFAWCTMMRRKRFLPPEIVKLVRAEQAARLGLRKRWPARAETH
jgi:biofilm PGA synthesis N-glycosyltransferase PgaC